MPLSKADENRVKLFRFDLLKPVIDSELRDRLPELLAAGLKEFQEAANRVLKDAKKKAFKLFEAVPEADAGDLKVACTLVTIADCNSVFPADYGFAMAMLFLDDVEDQFYAAVRRSLVPKVNNNDGFLWVPICRAKSNEDFHEGRYTISWIPQRDTYR